LGLNSDRPDIVILSIGGNAIDGEKLGSFLSNKNLKYSIFNLLWVKPLKFPPHFLESLSTAKRCLVLDPSFKEYGLAQSIAQVLTEFTNIPISIIASKNNLPGYAKELRSSLITENEIINEIKKFGDDE
jgi:deoxyxylulose-5-phosphate synthase